MADSLLDLCEAWFDTDGTAVIYDGGKSKDSLTYEELSLLSGKISTVLSEYSENSRVVGMCMDIQLVTPPILLGILKSGSAFYNFDSDALQYIRYVITQLGCQIVITDNISLKKLEILIKELDGEVRSLELCGTHINIVHLKAVQGMDHPANLAYCITTSGTTGVPKIVKVPHACVVPNILHIREIYNLTSDDLVVVCSPLTFDPSIVEIFTTLSVGGRLLIVPPVVKLIPDVLLDVICQRNQVTVIQATPTLLFRFGPTKLQNSLLGDKTSLRVLSLGGEEFPGIPYINSCKSKNNQTKFINLYGITEVSVWATAYQVTDQDLRLNASIPLGDCLKGTVLEVRDRHGHTVTDGHGELFIGGSTRQCIMMTSGLGDDTHEASVVKFRPSGDIVRLDNTGRMFYVGRKDSQIKRNGKRINLEEIKRVTLKYEGIQDSVTLMTESKLITFVTATTENIILKQSLRDKVKEHMVQHIPSHSVPDDAFVIDSLPITKHGKMDLNQLKDRYRAFCMDTDEVIYNTGFLRKHWMERLCIKDVEIKNDSNFIQLGGNSLTAVYLYNDLELCLNVQLPNLLDKLINETFKDCDKYILKVTKSAHLERKNMDKKDESDNDVDVVSDEVNKRRHRLSDIPDSFKGKKFIKRSNIILTISRGNHYVTCQPILSVGSDSAVYVNRHTGVTDETTDKLRNLGDDTGLTGDTTDKLSNLGDHTGVAGDTTDKLRNLGDDTGLTGDTTDKLSNLGDHTGVAGDTTDKLSNLGDHTGVAGDTTDKLSKIGDDTGVAGDTTGKLSNLGDDCCKDTRTPDGKGDMESKDLRINENRATQRRFGESEHELSSAFDDPLVGCPDFGNVQISDTQILDERREHCSQKCEHVDLSAETNTVSDVFNETNTVLDVSLTLEEGWRFNTGKCVDASPVIALNSKDSDMVFIGSHSHTFFAITMTTGDLVWEVTLGDRIEGMACVSLCGNFVIVGCYDGCIYSLDCETGSTWWKFQTGSQVKCGPVVDTFTGLVYIGSHNQSVYCLDIPRKMLAWHKNLDSGSVFSSPTIDNVHGKLFVATLGGKLFCLQKDRGEEVWQFDCKKPVFSSLACTDMGVLVGCTDTCLYHIHFNGHQLWKFQTGAPIFSTPSLFRASLHTDHHDNKQRTVFGSHDGFLYCLTLNGDLCWKTKVKSQIYSSPFNGLLQICDNTVKFVMTASDSNDCEQIDISDSPFSKTVTAINFNSNLASYNVLDSKYSSQKSLDITEIQNKSYFKSESNSNKNSSQIAKISSEKAFETVQTCSQNSFKNMKTSSKLTTKPNYNSMHKNRILEGTTCRSLRNSVILPVVVFCCTVGVLYIVDSRDGSILCERMVPGEIFSSPVLYGDSVFVGCRDDYVYRFRLALHTTQS